MEALQSHLSAMGLSLGHALYLHLFLSNLGHFAAANKVYSKYLPQEDAASRACVQVGGASWLGSLPTLSCV